MFSATNTGEHKAKLTSNLWSQVESQPIDNIIWGRLYGKNIKVKSLDLNIETFTAGRGENNDLILTLNDLPEKILCRISKVHFTITRANCDLSNPVYIERSSNSIT
ncbi:hypothetical protein DOY81_012567 [Sarcophaga bullata]|nr:hypothetical protein DOY81_012567 [Sarcophaga bullata]